MLNQEELKVIIESLSMAVEHNLLLMCREEDLFTHEELEHLSDETRKFSDLLLKCSSEIKESKKIKKIVDNDY